MELLADGCVLSLRPIVNVPKARWTLCNFWRSHLNLWHIKADISNIVEVHLVFDVLQFFHLLFELLLLVRQLYVAIGNLLFQIIFLATVPASLATGRTTTCTRYVDIATSRTSFAVSGFS